MLETELHGEAEQLAFGESLASALGAPGLRLLVFLEGELGAGKTTLVRGFLAGLGHRGPVRSPTYTLIEPYDVGGRRVYHLDLYRIADPDELEFLGLRELLAEPALVLVEWPQRGAGWLPQPDLAIRIVHLGDARRLAVEARDGYPAEVLARLADKLQ
ncbi:MAG: tRNA (adenosine(37)-N6)-threonylcarbamoyltransferase complex ATPase subunit type 1 TsaE [Gammaproteobacteria bacterium]|nr:tRNA (adenosine(37)-N6)-threonylcarbamoyltransferase complex ATPase subunit type 1 TsaE [Gammaproteobacteria bacterium]